MTKEKLKELSERHLKEVLESDGFKAQLNFLNNYSFDFINVIRGISLYSERASHIYDKQILNRGFDDVIQSAIAMLTLVNGGVQSTVRRELRYSLEMITKYLVVDQECSNDDLDTRIEYFKTNIPRSSVSVIDRATLPFDSATNIEFKAEVKSTFAELSRFVHPSMNQLEVQIQNYKKGNYIGFESLQSVTALNKVIFRVYDQILTMLFIGFGSSMSGDLFIELFDPQDKWKFRKGKYVSKYSQLFDYKSERK